MSNSEAIAAKFARINASAETQWATISAGEKSVVMVGTATCGRAAGALDVLKTIQQQVNALQLDTVVMEVGCIGYCYAEPFVVVAKPGYPALAYGYVTPGIAERLVQDYIVADDPCLEFLLGALEENELFPSILDQPRFQYERRALLQRCGQIDPEEILHYVAKGGYAALAKALAGIPQQVIDEVQQSGLRGRGGAGFKTGQKWQICRDAPGQSKYVVCNADEGDPGAFMDRALLESDPHSVIEGMIIAGYAVGADKGYVYVRAEYPLAVSRVTAALRQAKEFNLLGDDILGSGYNFHVTVFEGSGAFVCGEETALIASVEGKPGIPRFRPPFPATNGLFGMPTAINNVKTLASVPHIIANGPQWFSAIGTATSKGTAVFALAGKVNNTGLAEVAMGTTLRELVFEVGGGIPKGKRFKAVQIGGPSGGCLPESALDLPIDFDSLTTAGAMMGSGGIIVLDEDDCMVEVARYFLEFTQSESCGKCTMCRLGTKQMLAMLEDITLGRGQAADLTTLAQLAEDIKAGSLCALGKTAPNPVLSTLRYFGHEYQTHIAEARCSSLMCKELIAYYILPEKCERSCDICLGICTVEAIYNNKKRLKVIDQTKCVKCDTCVPACPPQYAAIIKLSPPGLVPPEGQPLVIPVSGSKTARLE